MLINSQDQWKEEWVSKICQQEPSNAEGQGEEAGAAMESEPRPSSGG